MAILLVKNPKQELVVIVVRQQFGDCYSFFVLWSIRVVPLGIPQSHSQPLLAHLFLQKTEVQRFPQHYQSLSTPDSTKPVNLVSAWVTQTGFQTPSHVLIKSYIIQTYFKPVAG